MRLSGGRKGTLMRRLRHREEGMTIAEVMIAMLILAIGSMAVLNLMTAGAHNSYRGEQSQVVSNRLQQEMEKIQNLPYNQIALTGLPGDSTDPRNPGWRVSGSSYSITQDGSQFRSLVYNGSSLYTGGTVSGGAVDPTPTHFTSGDVGGTIYRYVVWENDPSCSDSLCPGSQDMKRIIVAIVPDVSVGATVVRHYQELQTQVTNPGNAPVDNPGPPGPCSGGQDCHQGQCDGPDCTFSTPGTPWTFWLTDSTCNNTTRQPITGDHLLHNTDAVCSNGLKNSNDCSTTLGVTTCTPGAPDLMYPQAAPLDVETPLYDFATDLEPPQNPDQDKGLQMAPPSTNGCLSSLLQPLTDPLTGLLKAEPPSRMQTVHKWVTNTMGTGFNVTLSGTGSLNLWTQSINGASYSGTICFWIFEQHLSALGVPVVTPAVNADTGASYWQYSLGSWPTNWTELHIPLHFTLGVLSPNSRLGFAIQVEKAGTTGGGMQFLYDEPSFDSRLQVDTQTNLLPF